MNDSLDLRELDHLKDDPDKYVIKFFLRCSPALRRSYKEQYEKHIAISEGKYNPGVYPITADRSLAGKRRPMPEPMPPKLIEAFRRGLDIVNQIIELQDTPKP